MSPTKTTATKEPKDGIVSSDSSFGVSSSKASSSVVDADREAVQRVDLPKERLVDQPKVQSDAVKDGSKEKAPPPKPLPKPPGDKSKGEKVDRTGGIPKKDNE